MREVAGYDPIKEAKELERFCPIRHVTRDYPPTLLLHGDKDTDVPFEQSVQMADALKEHEVPHRLIRMENRDHLFDVFDSFSSMGKPVGLKDPKVAEAFDAVLEFLNEHVGLVARSADGTRYNKEIIRRLYDEVFVKWNLAVVDELVSADFVCHAMPPGTPPGPAGFRQFYGTIRTTFADVRYTVEDLIAEGDKVVVRWKWDATHRGDFLGIPPTGGPAPLTGIAIYRLADGKIVERWVEVDLLGLGQRLGAKFVPAHP